MLSRSISATLHTPTPHATALVFTISAISMRSSGTNLLGIVETGNEERFRRHDAGRDDRSGQRSASHFVDAGDERKALFARGRFELMQPVQAPALALVSVLRLTLFWVHRRLRT